MIDSRLAAVNAFLVHAALIGAVLVIATVCGPTPVQAQSSDAPFSWDQAFVYRLITDRFSSGDRTNNSAYGRGLDGAGTPYAMDSTGHFLGGDFAGLTGWLNDAYFSDLGVNTLLISAPYEQVHGWVGGGFGEFQRYGYDGQWPIDFTTTDLAFGTEEEFKSLVETAHKQGIRVLVEVSINQVGPPTMNDMAAFNFGGLTSEEWRSWRPESKSGWQSYNTSLVTLSDSTESWQRWWGSDWIRADLPGYQPCGTAPESLCFNMLPDLRDDVEVSDLPPFLQLKWGPETLQQERQQLSAFFAKTGYQRTATNHVIKWLSDMVASFGIDGFVVQHADNVSLDAIKRLKTQGTAAYETWKADHPMEEFSEATFWVAADFAGDRVAPTDVQEWGIDAVLNYGFKTDIESSAESQFTTYASQYNSDKALHVLSFLSSPTNGLFDRSSVFDAATRMLLSPGGVMMFYGDESGRPLGAEGVKQSERANSMMNWSTFDEDLLTHWKKLGAFRAAHPAIASGGHDKLQDTPYAFYRGVRVGMGKDEVVIALGAEGKTRLNVSVVWPDDTVLRDAYTGNVAIVSFGQVSFSAHNNGILLIEEVK